MIITALRKKNSLTYPIVWGVFLFLVYNDAFIVLRDGFVDKTLFIKELT